MRGAWGALAHKAGGGRSAPADWRRGGSGGVAQSSARIFASQVDRPDNRRACCGVAHHSFAAGGKDGRSGGSARGGGARGRSDAGGEACKAQW
eukprot:3576183-Prymnesium_polylepis.1